MALLRRRKSAAKGGGAPAASRGRKAAAAAPTGPSRSAQLRQAFSLTRQYDSKMLPMVLAAALVALAVFVVLGIVLGHPIYFTVLGVLVAAAAATVVFSRRASRAMLGQV